MRVLQIEDDVLTAAAVETILRSEGVVSDSWWKLVFGVAPDHDGCSVRWRGE